MTCGRASCLVGNICRSPRRLKGDARGRLRSEQQQSPIRRSLRVVSVGLARPPEGDGLANVLAGAECIQDEAGDVGSRNRREDGARTDQCGVAAGACSHRQAGPTDDGVVKSAIADNLLLQDLTGWHGRQFLAPICVSTRRRMPRRRSGEDERTRRVSVVELGRGRLILPRRAGLAGHLGVPRPLGQVEGRDRKRNLSAREFKQARRRFFARHRFGLCRVS